MKAGSGLFAAQPRQRSAASRHAKRTPDMRFISVAWLCACFWLYWLSCASERHSLTASTWNTLPDMHTAKWNFNSTVWRNAIYLCQGTSDVFDGRYIIQLPEAGNTISCA